VQVEVVNALEIPLKMLAHSVEGDLIHETVIRHEAHNAVAIPKPVLAQRKNFTYISESEFLLVALESFA